MGEKAKKPVLEWWECEETIQDVIKNDIIPQYHKQMNEANFKVLFRSQAKKLKGSEQYATTALVTGVYKYLTGVDYIIEIAHDLWETLNTEQQRAALDHELCHCIVKTEFKRVPDADDPKKFHRVEEVKRDESGNPEYGLRDHDVAEFAHILKEYGDWSGEIRGSMQQLDLFMEDAA